MARLFGRCGVGPCIIATDAAVGTCGRRDRGLKSDLRPSPRPHSEKPGIPRVVLVAGIHVFLAALQRAKTRMVGPSPPLNSSAQRSNPPTSNPGGHGRLNAGGNRSP